jgi:hypothetical protein
MLTVYIYVKTDVFVTKTVNYLVASGNLFLVSIIFSFFWTKGRKDDQSGW